MSKKSRIWESEETVFENGFAPQEAANDVQSGFDVDKISSDTGKKIFELFREEEGIELDPEEIAALQEALPELFKETSPEFAAILEEMRPKMETLQNRVEELRAKGDYLGAANYLMEFMEKEEAAISQKLPDGDLKDQLLAYMGLSIDLARLEEEANEQIKLQKRSLILECIPFYGSARIYAEVYSGKAYDGHELSKNERIWRATEATASLALDTVAVGGLLVGGAPSAAAEGAKAGAVAKKGLDAGRIMTRFAALIRKTTKYRKASKIIFKAGMVLRKYPALTKLALNYAKLVKKGKTVKLGDLQKYRGERQAVYSQMQAYKLSEADRRNTQQKAA